MPDTVNSPQQMPNMPTPPAPNATPPQPVPPTAPHQQAGTSGLAVAGLVLGVLALFGAFVPLFNILTLPFAALGLILAAVGLAGINKGRKTGKGIAIAGVVLGAIALVVTFGMYGAAGAASNATKSSSASTAASTTSEAAAPAEAQPEETAPTLGSTIAFDGMDIAFADSYTLTTLSNQFSERNGATVIEIPITITNTRNDKNRFNMFYVKAFGPSGNELDDVTSYFHENDASWSGEMMPGASLQTALHVLYEGDGTYTIDFHSWTEEVEVSFPVQA